MSISKKVASVLVLSFAVQTSFAQSTAQATADKSCAAGAPLDPAQVTERGLEKYLDDNASKFKDVGDLVCCLPENYRKRTAIVHSSASAQTSHFKGPRLLIFGCRPDGDPTCTEQGSELQSVLSINGGNEGLSQRHNIEAVFVNRQGKMLEMRDFELKDGHHEVSGANPETCMACHGIQGEDGDGGPKPIFDGVDRWTRMSSGIFSDCWFSGREASYLGRMQSQSEAAVRENPRFRCVSPGNAEDNAKVLDNKLAELNEVRAARIQQSTPDFKFFKYAIVANSMGCSDMTSMIPSDAIKRFSAAGQMMASSIAKAKDLNAECMGQAKAMIKANQAIAKFHEDSLPQIARGEVVEFRVQKGPFCASLGDSRADNVNQDKADRICAQFRSSYGDDLAAELFDRYKLDTMMVSNSNLTKDQTIWQRVLNESRGVDESQFQMQVRVGEFSARIHGVHFLVELLNKDNDLQFVKADLVKRNIVRNGVPAHKQFVKTVNLTPSDEVCKLLADKSNSALKAWLTSNPPQIKHETGKKVK